MVSTRKKKRWLEEKCGLDDEARRTYIDCMIGELLQSIFTEVVGTDPENRRIAALPLKAGKLGVVASVLDIGHP